MPKFSSAWNRRWRSGYIVFLHRNACRVAEAEYPEVGSLVTGPQNLHTSTAPTAGQAVEPNCDCNQSFEGNTPGEGRGFQPEQALAEIPTPAAGEANTRTTEQPQL